MAWGFKADSRHCTLQELTSEEPTAEFILPNSLVLWAWSGSTYSGFICMALGSIFYSMMEVVTKRFSGQMSQKRNIRFIKGDHFFRNIDN